MWREGSWSFLFVVEIILCHLLLFPPAAALGNLVSDLAGLGYV